MADVPSLGDNGRLRDVSIEQTQEQIRVMQLIYFVEWIGGTVPMLLENDDIPGEYFICLASLLPNSGSSISG